MDTRHLYVHVPFCAHRCGYCDFVTTSAQPEMHMRYVDALLLELATRADAGAKYATVFIGGGTPTLLERPALRRLLDELAVYAGDDAEVTIECNPETVTDELASTLAQSCVTRVSLGAQSFSASVLKVLERRATPETVRQAVATLRAAGIDNLSLDLIWGVPGQSLDDLEHDLASTVELGPQHISAYELEFKPGTRMAHAYPDVGRVLDDTADHYDCVIDTLTDAGYEWYELANFARDGRRSQHNLAYWQQRDYLGIGVGAVSTVSGERRTNHPNLPRYLSAVEAGDPAPHALEHIDEDTRRFEQVMLALRLSDPIRIADLSGAAAIGSNVDRLIEAGMLVPADEEHVVASRYGRMMLNTVLTELMPAE